MAALRDLGLAIRSRLRRRRTEPSNRPLPNIVANPDSSGTEAAADCPKLFDRARSRRM